ncbi:hypothetical protein J7399_19570 [Shimia sp. R9_1]|uniref:hypothetical protein n=1 Tax=Shimia sp. R9_1 TaxID=2821111 RepID=UPI001ADBF3E6|nr:hypothetical protein [Shimia sp. R9_1]MBO9409646.1 hypothetical protein [Shimia sp. R9_1]
MSLRNMLALLPRTLAVAALVSVGLTGAGGANDSLGAQPETDTNGEIEVPAIPFAVSAPTLIISVEGPLEIQAPPLVLAVEGPLEIDAPPLVLAVEGPLEINAPDLVLAVEGPLTIDAPALAITVFEPFVVTAPALPLIVEDDEDTDRIAQHLCVGTYTMFIGQVVGTSISHVMPIGTKEVARATVSSESCGASLTLAAQGQKILLARQHGGDNRYEGELHLPDGAKRKLSLTCGQNLTLFGGIVARDDRLQVGRQMWLQLDHVNEATLAACAERK